MKKLLVLAICCLFLTGCATTKITTRMGVMIGTSFAESAAMGEVSAEESIKAWPYVSGLIRGVMAANYAIDLPDIAKEIMVELDALASKTEPLTSEEKGRVIGYYVRLEQEGTKIGWDKYGISMMDLVSKGVGG